MGRVRSWILFLSRIKTLHPGVSDFHQCVPPFVFLSELCVRPHVLVHGWLNVWEKPQFAPQVWALAASNQGQVCWATAAAWELLSLSWALSLGELQLSSDPSPAPCLWSHLAHSALILLNWPPGLTLSLCPPCRLSAVGHSLWWGGCCPVPALLSSSPPLLSTPLVDQPGRKNLSQVSFFSPLYFWVLSLACAEILGNGGGYPCVFWIIFWGASLEWDGLFLFPPSVLLFLKCYLLLQTLSL